MTNTSAVTIDHGFPTPVDVFLGDTSHHVDLYSSVDHRLIYGEYQAWCRANGVVANPLSFAVDMRAAGWRLGLRRDGRQFRVLWLGTPFPGTSRYINTADCY